MANIVWRLLGNVPDLVDQFSQVAGVDPLSTILLVLGAVFVLFAVGVFGYLTAGALVSGIIPQNFGRTPSRRGE